MKYETKLALHEPLKVVVCMMYDMIRNYIPYPATSYHIALFDAVQ